MDDRDKRTFQRFILPVRGNALSSSVAAGTAGRAFCGMIQVTRPFRAVAIRFANGATVAGNVRAAIYGPTGQDSMVDTALVGQSADTACAGASTEQRVALAASKLLIPGIYYVCLQFSDTTHTIVRSSSNTIMPLGVTQRFDVDGGFGAFPATAPAMTNDQAISPLFVLEGEVIN